MIDNHASSRAQSSRPEVRVGGRTRFQSIIPMSEIGTFIWRGSDVFTGAISIILGCKRIIQLRKKNLNNLNSVKKTDQVAKKKLIKAAKVDASLDIVHGLGYGTGDILNLFFEFCKVENINLSYKHQKNMSTGINAGFIVASTVSCIRNILLFKAELAKPKDSQNIYKATSYVAQAIASVVGIIGHALLISREGGLFRAWGGVLAIFASTTLTVFWLLTTLLTITDFVKLKVEKSNNVMIPV